MNAITFLFFRPIGALSMSIHWLSPLVAITTFLLTPAPPAAQKDLEPTLAALRDQVLKADTREKTATAYKAFFLRLGRAGLRELMKDEDIGISLQATWEAHLTPAKRKEPDTDGRTDDVYDSDKLQKFLAYLKDRTKAPVPGWWAKGITDVDLFPGRHHAFIKPGKEQKDEGEANPQGRPTIKEKGDNLVFSAKGRSVEFPKSTFDEVLLPGFTGILGEKRSVIAALTPISGFSFKLAGFTGGGGKPAWTADVWAAGRDFLGGVGYHRMDMKEKDGIIYLFGMESHGAYMEAFDAATGKCRFRFCTCYWFHFSEAWGLN